MDWAALRRTLLTNYQAPGLPTWLTIPAFPTAVAAFSKKADDPDASAADLGRIVEADGGLTSELLRQVNCSAISLRHKASTAQRAISILGFHRSKLILLNTAARIALKVPELRGFDWETFSITNLRRGLFAQVVARTMGADEDLAFVGGMLSDCVLPILAAHDQDFYETYRENASDSEAARALTYFELKQFEYCHAYAAAQVCVGWKFPDDLICCIFLHHAPIQHLIQLGLNGSAVVAVRLAAYLPCPFNQEPDGLNALLRFEKHLAGIGLKDLFAEVDRSMAADYPQWDTADGLVALLDRDAEPVA